MLHMTFTSDNGQRLKAIALLLGICAVLAAMATLALGAFSRNGTEILRLHGTPERAIKDDRGRLLLLGRFLGEGSGIVRLRRDGSVDRTFGEEGFVAEPWSDAIVQSDGKILVLSTSFPSSGSDAVLTRLRPDGRLDPSFGGDGRIVVQLGRKFDAAEAIALAPDGKIVIAGGSATRPPEGRTGESDAISVIARLRPGGSLDPSFSRDGILPFSSERRYSFESLEVAGDETIVAFDRGTLVKVRVGGRLDTSFGKGGVVSIPTLDPAPGEDFFVPVRQFVLLRGGRLLVAGTVSRAVDEKLRYRVMLMRLRKDGGLDRSYGQDGYAKAGFRGFTFAGSLAVLRDGRAVVGASAQVPAGSDSDLAAIAFTPAGRIDRDFGRRGKASVDFPGWTLNRGTVPVAGRRVVLVGYSRADHTGLPRRPITVLARMSLR
jgi:uncharacterized delta-60 repeat protein